MLAVDDAPDPDARKAIVVMFLFGPPPSSSLVDRRSSTHRNPSGDCPLAKPRAPTLFCALQTSRRGGIGRRARLKIWFPKGSVGSRPSVGTLLKVPSMRFR